jgi:murein hydrolase activator
VSRPPALRALLVAACCAALVAVPSPAQQPTLQQAEQKLRDERAHLEQLRAERQELERRRVALQSTVHDLSEELDNVNRMVATTARVVASLDAQLEAINADISATTAELLRAQDELLYKRIILERRLVDIYKRGGLYNAEVLLSANSFADLVARYKYLHLAALRDQALVKRVDDLRKQIDRQRKNLVRFQTDIEVNLAEKADEQRRLRGLQQEQARSLASSQAKVRETEKKLAALSEDEQKLTDLIGQLEIARKAAERASTAKRPGEIKHSGTGTLDWPCAGPLLYSFGRVVNPNNTTVRWNGVGISCPDGTAVHAVVAGRVIVAEPFGTYGLTVIVQHPGGEYSVYGSLSRLAAKKGDVVSRGQVVGYVGTSDPEFPSHLHFEWRPEGHAADPLDYLKPQP